MQADDSDMREALDGLADRIAEAKKDQAERLAALARGGIQVMPSPMLNSGEPVLLVSQADYDAMLKHIDEEV